MTDIVITEYDYDAEDWEEVMPEDEDAAMGAALNQPEDEDAAMDAALNQPEDNMT